MKRRVAIIGGGLAGLAAAVRLAEADCQVIVIETRRKLGGRATSFIDPRTNEVLDNCQHVLMGCCTHLIDFYDRIGVLDTITWHRTLYWTRLTTAQPTDPSNGYTGVIDTMKAGMLPAPLHFMRSFRRMRIFSSSEKRAIARAMWHMIRMGAAGRYAWRSRTFAAFLEQCKQPESVIRSFWNTIIVSACNLDVHRVSASCAIHVFQEGFLANKWSYTMGLATTPLWALYEPVTKFLEARGNQLRLGESARSIAFDGTRATGVVTEHALINASAVVSAVPFDRLGKLASRTMQQVDPRLQHLDQLRTSSILGVHLRFDRPVMPPELPHLVIAPGMNDDAAGVHWLFNKGATPEGSQHVHAVISAADAWMPLDEQTIAERVLADLYRALPQSKGLRPMSVRAVKEKRATFAATPESERFRPSVAPGTLGLKGGGVPNLYLAGDWVDTGWPATMEGAVRSGYAAAAAIAGHYDRNDAIEDVPPGRLASLLGLR